MVLTFLCLALAFGLSWRRDRAGLLAPAILAGIGTLLCGALYVGNHSGGGFMSLSAGFYLCALLSTAASLVGFMGQARAMPRPANNALPITEA